MKLASLILASVLALSLPSSVFAAVATVTASPGSSAGVADIGTLTWSSVANAKVCDSTYSFTTDLDSGETTNYIAFYNFGLALDPAVPILGYELNITAKGSLNPQTANFNTRIAPGGTISTTETVVNSAVNIDSTGNHTFTVGGPTENFSRTLTGADVNDTNFGFYVYLNTPSPNNGDVYIDCASLTVYYEGPDICPYNPDFSLGDTECVVFAVASTTESIPTFDDGNLVFGLALILFVLTFAVLGTIFSTNRKKR